MSLTTPWYLLLWERPAEDQGKQYRSMGTVYTYSDAKRWAAQDDAYRVREVMRRVEVRNYNGLPMEYEAHELPGRWV